MPVGMADTRVAKRYVTDTTVLVIAGISTGMVSHELTGAGALSIPNGITLNVFDQLGHLPPYSETSENHRFPRLVTALHTAAFEAHAALVLTDYHEHIPATVRNAIDWLTRRRNHSALQDKPVGRYRPDRRLLQRGLGAPPYRRVRSLHGNPCHRTDHRHDLVRGRHQAR